MERLTKKRSLKLFSVTIFFFEIYLKHNVLRPDHNDTHKTSTNDGFKPKYQI